MATNLNRGGRMFGWPMGLAALACLLAWPAGSLARRGDASDADAGPKKPPTPAIASIQLEPASLTLLDGRDGRQALVWGIAADGQRYDLTDEATFKSDSARLAIVDGHYIYGHGAGQSIVVVSAGGKEANLPVTVQSADEPPIRFTREVMPILASVGCNAGTCHGSAKGKNGFKLSLRGYDADHDYNMLVNDLEGRRVNRVQPEQSLMLLKPTAAVPHEGRQVILPGSRQYQIIYEWIKEGVHREPDPATARPDGVSVLPADVYLDLPGRTQRLVVLAHYPDGTTREVTRDAVLSASNIDVAHVDGNRITALRRGESALLIRYEGQYATVNITVMGDRTGFAWQPMPEYNYIDGFVNAKLQKMKILPSDECTDADFIRRVYLDLTGVVPTAERVRTFLQDPAPTQQKRAKLVDSLIGNKDYVAFWTNKWADLLQCNDKALNDRSLYSYREWIRRSVAENKPYDQFVRELIDAEGSSLDNPAVNYYRSLKETGKMTEDISQTFLGVRFNCNKCHDHPFEKWTQGQYYQFGAFFARVAFKPGARPDEEIVFNNYAGGEVVDPRSDRVSPPLVPYGAEPDLATARDRQQAFAIWLTSKDNPLFAHSYANRVWSYFFGRGIIDPVDDIRASNPPCNPRLLDALTDDFVKGGFDARKLMRTIVLSRTYQLSIKSNKWNADDTINFSHAAPRRLSAEQILDAVSIVTGTDPRVPGLPPKMRSVYLAVGSDDFLKLFGRPKRESACECERTTNLSLAHALNLVNGSVISGAVDAPDNAVAKLVASEPNNRKVVEGIYLAVLNRMPTDAEVAEVDLGAGPKRLEAAQDLEWALLNSPAFLFNR